MSRSLTWSQRVRFQFAAITRMALRINRGMVTSKTLWAVVISKLKSWKMWNIFQRFECSFSNFFLFGPPISLPQSKLNERKVLLSSPVFVSLSCNSNAGCCACLILFSFLYIRKDWGCEVMTSRLVFSAGRVTKVYESTLALTILLVNMKAIFAVIITT